LHAGKEAERHGLEHRNTRSGLDLRGDQNQVADEHDDEHHAGALSKNLGALDVEHFRAVSYQLSAISVAGAASRIWLTADS
jgi:hypothetical protein